MSNRIQNIKAEVLPAVLNLTAGQRTGVTRPQISEAVGREVKSFEITALLDNEDNDSTNRVLRVVSTQKHERDGQPSKGRPMLVLRLNDRGRKQAQRLAK
jgi:hypothetical protein